VPYKLLESQNLDLKENNDEKKRNIYVKRTVLHFLTFTPGQHEVFSAGGEGREKKFASPLLVSCFFKALCQM
jgi:hypothetical protein